MIRIASAVVLLVVVIGTVWFLPPAGTVVLAVIVSGLAAHEYGILAGALGARVPAALVIAAVAAACFVTGSQSSPPTVVLMTAFLAIGAVAVAGGVPGPSILANASASVFPIVYIGLPLGALAAVRLVAGREALLLLMATIIVSDSAQYYVGSAFGRRPLAPAISPKKTVEGAIGGLLFGTAAMALIGLRVFPQTRPLLLVLVAATIVLLGIVGDLFESLLKRSAGVKDSAALIPGHGGLLDRIDSWLFAAPVYYVFVIHLQGS
jgi:phosphatidate cytidylyltransferase